MPQRTHWFAIAILVLVGVTAALEFAKVSAVFEAVSAHYGADASAAAWFVSLPALVTIVFGLTGSVFAARIGFRRTLIASLGLAIALSVVQATLPHVGLFLASRVIDGAVQLGIVVAAPVLILQFATPRSRPFAMALWGTFFGLAFALAGLVAPRLVGSFGLASVFLAHAALATVLLGVVLTALPRVSGDTPQASATVGFLRAHLAAYRQPRAFLPGVIFIFHTALYAVFVLYVPRFAPESVGGVLLVWMPLVSILGTVCAGVLTSTWLSPPALLIASFLGLIGCLAAIALTADDAVLVTVWALALMSCSGLIQGASFSLIPALTSDATTTAEANGVLMQLGNLGTLIGPPLFALTLGGAGGFALLAAVLCIGGAGVAMLALRRTGLRAST